MDKSRLRLAIIILTVITALIHLGLYFTDLSFIAFLLNAIGYGVLLAVFAKWLKLPFLAGREKLVWYVFMGFTAVTIAAYFVLNGSASLGYLGGLGIGTKVDELLLIGCLWLHKE
jgi:hypothetical protein